MTATQWLTRAVCALLALTLLLGSLLVIVEVGLAAADREPWLVPHPDWEAWLRGHQWDDRLVTAILAGLVVVGLLLVFLAVRGGKRPTLPLRPRTTGVDVTASRRSVEKSLVAAASRTSGVTGAEASVRGRSARVEVSAATRSTAGLKQEVESAVTARLASLGLTRDLRTKVRVHEEGNR